MNLNNADSICSFFKNEGMTIYSTAENTIKRFLMQSHIERGVLIGLSGGADSIMCLYLLLEYKRRSNIDFPILAVHVNHMIRGEEADRDETFCRDLCNQLSVEFISKSINVPEIATKNGIGIEECARNERYSYFHEIISSRSDIASICIAHNISDLAETVILNILRGSGSRGAAGIPPVRDNIFRPLIEVQKSEIIEALDSAGIDYVTDSSNLTDDYKRNYVRHNVIPCLDDISVNSERMLARLAFNLRSDDDYIRGVAIEFLKENSPVSSKALLSLHNSVFVRVLSIMAEQVGGQISSKIADDIRGNLSSNSFTYSVIGARFVCEQEICYFDTGEEFNLNYSVGLSLGENRIDAIQATLVMSETDFDKTYLNVYKKSIKANLSSAIINGRVYIRPKADGDSVYYGGMTHKLKKLFNDRKIPISHRKHYPVICDDSGVLWVPGFGVRDDGVPLDLRRDLFVLLGYTE